MMFSENRLRKYTAIFSFLFLCLFIIQVPAQNNNGSSPLGTAKSESTSSGSNKTKRRTTTTAKTKKSQKSGPTKNSTATEKRSTNKTGSSKSVYASEDVIGTWRSRVTEFGQTIQYDVSFYENGSTEYLITDSTGKLFQIPGGSWTYSKGTLYEKLPDGTNGKGSVQWLDRNNLILTIIDNGDPRYTGLKRRYTRIY